MHDSGVELLTKEKCTNTKLFANWVEQTKDLKEAVVHKLPEGALRKDVMILAALKQSWKPV